jgi:hypothetical protein
VVKAIGFSNLIKPEDNDYKKDLYVKLNQYLQYILDYSVELELNDSETIGLIKTAINL